MYGLIEEEGKESAGFLLTYRSVNSKSYASWYLFPPLVD